MDPQESCVRWGSTCITTQASTQNRMPWQQILASKCSQRSQRQSNPLQHLQEGDVIGHHCCREVVVHALQRIQHLWQLRICGGGGEWARGYAGGGRGT